MRLLAIIPAVLALAAFIAIGGLAIHAEVPIWYIYEMGSLISGMANLLLVGALLAVTFAPTSAGNGVLAVFGWLALALGLLAALFEASMTWQAVQATGITRLKVIAPSLMGALLPLALGLLAAAIASARLTPRQAA